jgi:iron complex outermembrane receptor protein
VRTRSLAAFAQGSYEITDGLSLIAGIRFGQDRKHLVSNYLVAPFTPYNPSLPPPPGQERGTKTWSSTTPKFGIQYQLDRRTLLYATYAKGFKAGGFDATSDPSVFLKAPTYNPEQVTSYEVGLKTTLLNGRARINLAGFYYDYANLQVSQAGTFAILTSNAGKARIFGLEGELTLRPIEHLEIGFSGSYLNAKYTSYIGVDNAKPLVNNVDFKGNFLNNAPEWSGTLSAQYAIPVGRNELTLRGEEELSSRYYFSPGNYALVGQGGYAKTNASLSYRIQNGIEITAFVRNIANKMTRVSAQIESIDLGAPVQGSIAPPRTFGIEGVYRF